MREFVSVLTVILFVAFKASVVQCNLKVIGPVGPIDVHNIRDCEARDKIEGLSLQGQLGKKNGKQVVSGKLRTPFPIDDEVEVDSTVDRYYSGTWQKNINKVKGRLCDFISKYFKPLWHKVQSLTKPKVPKSDCYVKEGTYTLTDYFNYTVVELPSIPYGLFRFTFKFGRRGKIGICKIVEFTFHEKPLF